MIKLYALSHGYVAICDDESYFGGPVPLAFGTEKSAHQAVNLIAQANPRQLVSFAGGLAEYRNATGSGATGSGATGSGATSSEAGK